MNDFIENNRSNWDERVAEHLKAYRAEAFADDKSAISKVVLDDERVLSKHLPNGSVDGLKLAHLQCHIGTDTISWARLGAHATGIDFSAESINAARMLAQRAGVDVSFVTSTVDEAAEHVSDRFDVVYTSVGVLPWLPRLDSWAATIFALLKPGGVFYVRDAHPVLNALDQDREDGQLVFNRPYFETSEPIRYDDGSSYASDAIQLVDNTVTYEWSHSLSEIIQSLLNVGLSIEAFHEGTTIPWRALPILTATPAGFAHPSDATAVPLEFTLIASRRDRVGK